MKKVDELTGAELDFWVAKADGKKPMPDGDGGWFTEDGFEYSPSVEWEDSGPIIEREGISIDALWGISGNLPVRLWCAERNGVHCQSGTTPLVAAMRCFVASKFGDEVDDSQTHNL